ncbi:MAG: Fe-S cluster assembly ATPase SufC [Malacoplasma sp.]|nr:Fe-S cluster assembly ATPase SufC [Malacoplasma sp.]
MEKLTVKNLHVSINEREILKGIDIEVNKGEVVAVLGPNGHGKSTLLKAIMHHYTTEITEGSILVDNQDTADLETDEIARLGLFLAPQHSEEIPGVTMLDFLRSVLNARAEQKMKLSEYFPIFEKNLKSMNLDREYLNRFVNYGFSGGEKKKCEILQMKIIQPDFVLLDEIDSGLDIDSLKMVVDQINNWKNENKALIVVSHHENLFKKIIPNRVYVIIDGKVAISGGVEIYEKINKEGYQWINDLLGK